MSDSRRYTFRLDNDVADYYDELARAKGVTTPILFTNIMTNNMQEIAMKTQADRIEDLVDRVERRIEEFEEKNNFNEKFYEDFSGLYFMMLWVMMKSNASKDEIRAIQAKGYTYADENYKGALK
ncbi:hypothetical protein [Acinetobacter variabilis]|uniref:hypothetical protein n=1 Tax=Acinetobacter variabilis TaxID=70346 RepID=UPI00289FB1DE|nr:hypothetical protein [Acinetobacter variabilis]